MRSINEVRLLGNLGKDPEVKQTPGGKAVALLSVATNKVWRDKKSGEKKESTQWHRVVLWDKLADVAKKYLVKGSPVHVSGELQSRHYDSGEGTKWVTEVVGFDLILLSAPSQTTRADHHQDPAEITDEDIPF